MSIRPVTMPERKRMREMRAQGMTFAAISLAVGRPRWTVARHAGDIALAAPPSSAADRMKRRAQRNERLFASCARALDGARP